MFFIPVIYSIYKLPSRFETTLSVMCLGEQIDKIQQSQLGVAGPSPPVCQRGTSSAVTGRRYHGVPLSASLALSDGLCAERHFASSIALPMTYFGGPPMAEAFSENRHIASWTCTNFATATRYSVVWFCKRGEHNEVFPQPCGFGGNWWNLLTYFSGFQRWNLQGKPQESGCEQT